MRRGRHLSPWAGRVFTLLWAALLTACQPGYLGGGDAYGVPFRAELLAGWVSGRPGDVVELPYRVTPLYLPGPDLIVCTWVARPDGSPPPQLTEDTTRLNCVLFSGLEPTEEERSFQVAPGALPGAWALVLHVKNDASAHRLPFTLEVRP